MHKHFHNNKEVMFINFGLNEEKQNLERIDKKGTKRGGFSMFICISLFLGSLW